MRQIARLSQSAHSIIYSSLIWQNIRIDEQFVEFLPNFKSIANFITTDLKEFEHLHVIDFSQIFITQALKHHEEFFK